jgi:hypothetical protein
VTLGPRLPVIKPDPVTQQQLREPVPGAHQIDPDLLARADQIAQCFLLGPRHPDRVQLAGDEQPREILGVTPIGLDPIPRPARDLARRRHDALHATARELTRKPIPGRAGLIRNPRRPRQPRAEPRRLNSLAAHLKSGQLPGLDVQHRRDDLRRVHVQADDGLSLRHGWFLLCD